MGFESGIDGTGYATLGLGDCYSSELMRVLMNTQDIVPGQSPSYEACKTLYSYHPVAYRMVDKPLELALSQERKITVPNAPEEMLLDAYRKEWGRLGGIGGDNLIFRIGQIARIYGIGTLACNIIDGDKKEKTSDPLPMDDLFGKDLAFYIFDPLNTAGSLILNQDPAAVDFLTPRQVRVGSESWSNTKCSVLMNEQPIWIQWTDSAFGFVGRSVFQRAFYPLKTFVSSMIADNLIQEKLALIVHKAKSPGSIVDRRAFGFFNLKRQAIKGAKTGNVLQIGIDEDVQSLDLDHVHTAGEYSRTNCLKNIATASGMPAILLLEDTLAQGFGEGSEDAKQLARYIDKVRLDLHPAYRFLDLITMRRAWGPEFYEAVQRQYPQQYGKLSYEAAFQSWSDAFRATWPNLLSESDSEKAKGAESRIKSAVDIISTILPNCDPANAATVLDWLTQIVNNEKEFLNGQLILDTDALEEYIHDQRLKAEQLGASAGNGNDESV